MVLENKLGITESAELAREEERISKTKASELFEKGILDSLEAGKFSSLSKIHKHLFDEIYPFAGEIRDVNLAKGNFRFAPVMYLKPALEHIDNMPQSTFEEIIDKYVEMNVAHPFRPEDAKAIVPMISMIKIYFSNILSFLHFCFDIFYCTHNSFRKYHTAIFGNQ